MPRLVQAPTARPLRGHVEISVPPLGHTGTARRAVVQLAQSATSSLGRGLSIHSEDERFGTATRTFPFVVGISILRITGSNKAFYDAPQSVVSPLNASGGDPT